VIWISFYISENHMVWFTCTDTAAFLLLTVAGYHDRPGEDAGDGLIYDCGQHVYPHITMMNRTLLRGNVWF
jgi:hypothetical protein